MNIQILSRATHTIKRNMVNICKLGSLAEDCRPELIAITDIFEVRGVFVGKQQPTAYHYRSGDLLCTSLTMLAKF